MYCHEITIFSRQHDGITTRLPTRYNRNLMDHVGIIQYHPDNGMSTFMVCHNPTFFFGNDTTFLGRAGLDTVASSSAFNILNRILSLWVASNCSSFNMVFRSGSGRPGGG